VPEPIGIMEKSATIMNYDLGGESIEGFAGLDWAGRISDFRGRSHLVAWSQAEFIDNSDYTTESYRFVLHYHYSIV